MVLVDRIIFTLAKDSESPVHGEYLPITSDGKPSARITCPKCGITGSLDHEIDFNGNVSPSVECPNDDCSFHTNIQLKDYRL